LIRLGDGDDGLAQLLVLLPGATNYVLGSVLVSANGELDIEGVPYAVELFVLVGGVTSCFGAAGGPFSGACAGSRGPQGFCGIGD
jgi:hypothetical protein